MISKLDGQSKENDCSCGGTDGSCQSGACQCGSGTSGCQGGPADPAEARRRFLQRAVTVSLGAFSLTYLSVKADEVDSGDDANNSEGQTADDAGGDAAIAEQPAHDGEVVYGFLVDTERCIGAGKCLTACREENNVPEGFHRTWVERYVHFKDGTVQVDTVPETGYTGANLPVIDESKVERAYFAPKLCNHCEDAPCNQVCPTHASITSPEGVELIDPETCIGCAYCVQACPYGVRFINPETNNADKCTWCYHRITKDELPACVEACPTGARVFGRLDDPNSEISRRIATVPTSVLKAHLGTHPKLSYVGISDEVI